MACCGCNSCFPRFRTRSNIINNNFYTSTNDVSQFSTLTSSTVGTSAPVFLTTINVNTNPERFVLNTDGTVSIEKNGYYRVMYSVTVTYMGEGTQVGTFGLAVDGTIDTKSSSTTQIASGASQTLTGHTIINITNAPNTISLINNSGIAFSVINASIIVEKIL